MNKIVCTFIVFNWKKDRDQKTGTDGKKRLKKDKIKRTKID